MEVVFNSVSHALNEDRVLNFSRQMASVIQFKMAHHQASYLALFIRCLKVQYNETDIRPWSLCVTVSIITGESHTK